MNCLGLVLPLSRVSDNAVEDLCDAGFDKLLVRHTVAAQKEDLPLFFLILRAICPKQDLQINHQLLNLLLSVVFESFGNSSPAKKEINQSGTMLMAHLDCFESLIADRVSEMENEKKTAAENKKVLLQNK